MGWFFAKIQYFFDIENIIKIHSRAFLIAKRFCQHCTKPDSENQWENIQNNDEKCAVFIVSPAAHTK